jgi:Reverse transcriptase (RNA-dependent DNA polymerase)
LNFVQAISDADRIEAQLHRLAARAGSARLARLVQDGVRLRRLIEESRRTSRLLARALADGSFAPGAVTLRAARIGGKERLLAALAPLDLVAHAVIADELARRLEPRLSPQLFSYRRGRSSLTALRAVARGVSRHRRAHADPRARGLFVLRADVQDYTDSWPIDDGAPLWPDLRGVTGLDDDGAHWRMLRRLLVPEIVGAPAPVATSSPPPPASGERRGLLFGAPTTNVLANLYLAPLDAELDAVPGLLYARFGDDVFCAHPDLAVLRAAQASLEAVLSARGLRLNQRKVRLLFWNGAGRRSPSAPQIEGAREVAFVGGAVSFSGGIALSPRKWSALVGDLRARVRRTAAVVRASSPPPGDSELAQVLVDVVNQSLSIDTPLATDYAPLLGGLVSDRRQLAELDRLLALWIAEAVSQRAGVRAFRDLPWRRLRALGLQSLVKARNG